MNTPCPVSAMGFYTRLRQAAENALKEAEQVNKHFYRDGPWSWVEDLRGALLNAPQSLPSSERDSVIEECAKMAECCDVFSPDAREISERIRAVKKAAPQDARVSEGLPSPGVQPQREAHDAGSTDGPALRPTIARSAKCDSCGYVESHDPNCPLSRQERLANKIEQLGDDGSEGCPFDQDELDMIVKALRSPSSTAGTQVTLDEANRCYLQQFDRAEALQKALDAMQAELDRVMLEHCPDEMTPEQIENWKHHQVPVRDDLSAIKDSTK